MLERLSDLYALFAKIEDRMSQGFPSHVAEILMCDDNEHYEVYTSSKLPPFGFNKNKIQKVDEHFKKYALKMDLQYFQDLYNSLLPKKRKR